MLAYVGCFMLGVVVTLCGVGLFFRSGPPDKPNETGGYPL